jgi:hypothetical protein
MRRNGTPRIRPRGLVADCLVRLPSPTREPRVDAVGRESRGDERELVAEPAPGTLADGESVPSPP